MLATFCFYQIEILSTRLLGHLEFQMCLYYPHLCAETTTRTFWNDPFAHLISGIGTETFCHTSAGGYELLDFFNALVLYVLLLVCKVTMFTLVLNSTCTSHSSHRISFFAASVDFCRSHFHHFRVTCVSVYVHVQTHICLLEVCLS